MKIAVLHDYANVFRETRAYPRLHDHEVTIHTEAYTEPERVLARPISGRPRSHPFQIRP